MRSEFRDLVIYMLALALVAERTVPAHAAEIAPPVATSAALPADSAAPYAPGPENLAARQWFREAGFGVFIHWGVYSVLGRGEWVMEIEKKSVKDYEPLAAQFDPEKFDAEAWAALFERAGAKYVTITSKHHDGFCMWDSKQSDWDIVDRTPYKKDVLKQLAAACRRHHLKLFFYHSQLDWHHPDYFPRGMTGHHGGRAESGDFNHYLDYMDAELSELLGGEYGDVGGIWFDGWWDQQTKRFKETKDAPVLATHVDWRLRQTYDLIHRLQPACLVGANHHVVPFAGEDFQMFERDLPGENKGGHSKDAQIGQLPLETCDTINGAWGYNAGDKNFKTVPQLVQYLVRAAGRDANLLLNIGPRPDGTIDPDSTARLEGVGEWLKTYERTIRPTHGGPIAPQAWGAATQTPEVVYLHVLDAKAASPEGWLTLTGTAELKADAISRFADGQPITARRSAAGELEVKRDWGDDVVDMVLVVQK